MPEDKLSFVPQKKFESLSYKKGGPGFLFIITLIIFIASLGVYGGLFYYKNKISEDINNLASDLERSKEAFDVPLINQLKDVSDKIDSVQSLVERHIRPTFIFELLEKETLKTITFKSLSYDKNNEFSAEGTAPDYKSLALQADVLEKNPSVASVFFSGLSLGDEGKISFTVKVSLNPSFTTYKVTE